MSYEQFLSLRNALSSAREVHGDGHILRAVYEHDELIGFRTSEGNTIPKERADIIGPPVRWGRNTYYIGSVS